MRSLTLLVLLTVASIYSLMVVGAYVTTGGYGLACPDWPTCRGQIFPPLEDGVVVEYTHRLLTVLSTLLLFGSTFAIWRSGKGPKRALIFFEIASLLLVIQIVLGGIVVGAALNALLVTLHLANSLLIFGLTVAAAVMLGERAYQQR